MITPHTTNICYFYKKKNAGRDRPLCGQSGRVQGQACLKNGLELWSVELPGWRCLVHALVACWLALRDGWAPGDETQDLPALTARDP
jgi:hypothetical protein